MNASRIEVRWWLSLRVLSLSLGLVLAAALPSLNYQGLAAQSPPPSSENRTLDINRAKAIKQKMDAGETVSAEDRAYLEWARQEFQKRQPGKQKGGGGGAAAPANTTPVSDPNVLQQLIPLDELKGSYKGEDGGLYGGGRNAPPVAHLTAYQKESGKIQPLDADGQPSPKGKIVILSIGMSNTTMEYQQFVRLAEADPDKSPNVVVVDGAKGGRTGAAWALDGVDLLPEGESERLIKGMAAAGRNMTKGPGDTWNGVEERLKAKGVTPQQIQVLWIKQAEAMPAKLGEFPAHARFLQSNLVATLNIAKQKYPNLRVAYLSSRIFGGYATTQLNPEPYAYEEAFSMRWLIQDQIKGEPRLNYDPDRGPVKAPIAMWGPYLWANGNTPRQSDGLVWKMDDLVVNDRTHPSDSGREKVAKLLLNFLKSDAVARSWFVKGKRGN